MQSRLVVILRRCNVRQKSYPQNHHDLSQQDLRRCFQTLSTSKLSPSGRTVNTLASASPIVSSSMRLHNISTQHDHGPGHGHEHELEHDLFKSTTSTAASSGNKTNTRRSSKDDNTNHTLEFTSANIKRLLQEELLSLEKSLQHISSSATTTPSPSHKQLQEDKEHESNRIGKLHNDNANNRLIMDRKQKENQQPTIAQLLQKFQNKTNDNDNTTTTKTTTSSPFLQQKPPDPKTTPLHEIQQFFELQSQQEFVSKYEAIIANAREREDYTSLSIVQRNLLNWYTPLRQRILEEQTFYFTKNDTSKSMNNSKVDKKKGILKYGPFLSLLQAEKLAILTSHEATMFSLMKGGDDNATLLKMALKISDAIEAEVNVQRLLKIRFEERSKASSMTTSDDEKSQNNITTNNNFDSNNNNNHVIQSSSLSLLDEEMKHDNDITTGHKKTKEVNNEWMYGPSHLQRFVDELNRNDPGRKGKVRIQSANRRARQLLESTEPWATSDKVALGVALIKMLIDTAKVNLGNHHHSNDGVPAFIYEKKWMKQNYLVGCVTMNEEFYKMVVEDRFCSLDAYTTRHKPMVIPPKDWTSFNDGGYMVLDTEFMRSHGCHIQKNALKEADLSIVMDGLNVLGRVPWVINRHVLNVAERCWDEGIVLGDIPSRVDHELPPTPIRPDGTNKDYKESQGDFRAYREALMKYRRIHQKNMDLRSLRCSAILKLNQADQFKDFEKIYFPYNVDFRGRAYPVPPHLSNIGSDLCRGMLTFSESKPLGPRGLYWLKVHLANLAGNDKISFDERAAFTDKNMENVRACVSDPFGENRWWMTLDDPFQGLATCNEIVNAIDSGSPETYECSLPVHMDGSCNGLQHYAALGRDMVGGKAVNLCQSDKPEDVYSGVMEEVIRRVAAEAERYLDINESEPDKLTRNERKALADHRAARLVNGLIDRGVVKRTVMTSVYGVTYIGAKKQIQEKIEEKLEAQGIDVDERADEIYAACGYLATVTMDVMGDLFQGARQTMNWLTTCAKLISSQGQPVSWKSPTGVPAVQPYRKKQPYRVVTLLQTVLLINNNDNLPIHKNRQTSAFPPNYIHSLDSAHMLLTAIEMDKRGLTFSAVHDSFWTHAADIDEMNEVLRSCFIDLYNKPLLEELKETWELQYPSLEFPDLPERGNLDLEEVRRAPYFFQ